MRIAALVLLSWLGAWACAEPPPEGALPPPDPGLSADLLGPADGRLETDADGVTTVLKVGSRSGSRWLAMGIREMPSGTGLPAHRHDLLEEILYVTEGSGWLVLGEQRLRVEEGSTVWVPPGTLHGLENSEGPPLRVLWVTAFGAAAAAADPVAESAATVH